MWEALFVWVGNLRMRLQMKTKVRKRKVQWKFIINFEKYLQQSFEDNYYWGFLTAFGVIIVFPVVKT